MTSRSYKVSLFNDQICSISDVDSIDSAKTKRLSWRTKIFFSFGHIYNDLCASVWFSYTLIYFQLHLMCNMAGILILLGQVADAIATPFIGFESDRNDTNHWLCRYGKRKTWHLFGTILVTCSFPFIFNDCIQCSDASDTAKMIYYSVFIVIFQIGWAGVQVSHISLITDLSPNSKERVELNSYRQAATVASSIVVYSITWLLLSKGGDSTIKEEDSNIFTFVVYIISAIGIIFSVLFHIFIRELKSPNSSSDNNSFNGSSSELIIQPSYRERLSSFSSIHKTENKSNADKHYDTIDKVKPVVDQSSINPESGLNKIGKIFKWSDWFKNLDFYKVGFIYMVTRLFVNLTQIYTPLYLQKTLMLPKKSIAIIPFVTYISGFVWSLITRFISAKTGPKILLVIGCGLGISSCIWNNFGSYDNEAFKQWQIYLVSLIFGVGGTTMLIASLALTADMIGENTGSAAFVFGSMSFFDKILSGSFVLVLEQLNPNKHEDQEISIKYYQQIIVFVSGFAVMLAFLGLLSIIRSKLGKVDKLDANQNNNQNETNISKLKY